MRAGTWISAASGAGISALGGDSPTEFISASRSAKGSPSGLSMWLRAPVQKAMVLKSESELDLLGYKRSSSEF